MNHKQPYIPGAGAIADTSARIKYLREGEVAFPSISPLFSLICPWHVHQQSIIKWNWYIIHDTAHVSSQGTSKLHLKKNYQIPTFSIATAMPSALNQAAVSTRPLISGQMKKKTTTEIC